MVSLRLRAFLRLTSPVSATRRTVLQKVRGPTSLIVVPQLVDTGFQVLFHSPPGVLFTFPSQYSALSVTEEYLALRGGPRSFPQGFSCPVVLWILPLLLKLRLRGFHPLRPVFPGPFPCPRKSLVQSEPQNARALVWALPISLAATFGIDVSFSSSGYLDVSVHRVPFHTLWIQIWIHGVSPCGFPHSDIRGSLDICSSPRLFAAYHVFLRLLVPRHPPCALLCLTFLFFHDCIALQPCSLFSFFASASFSLLSQLSASASHCLFLLFLMSLFLLSIFGFQGTT